MGKYEKKFFNIENEKFSVFINKNVFLPNFTTNLLIKSVKKIIKKNHKVLDLGCGAGVIGCYFFKKKIIKFIYGSDLSSSAVECAIYNTKKLTNNFDIRESNLLNEWKKEKFNIIINDISGISSEINTITDWFKYAPNNSGKDGVKFTINIIKNYKKNTLSKGKLVFPVLGLSNRSKIISYLKKEKIRYRILDKKEWPLPQSMLKHRSFLKKLKKKRLINYDEKFGIIFTTTEIFCCE